jgi:hypothetical protein
MNEKRTRIQASQLGVPVTVHACQSEYEVANVVDRYGKTPIAWIRDIGFLRANVILGHALYLSGTNGPGIRPAISRPSPRPAPLSLTLPGSLVAMAWH